MEWTETKSFRSHSMCTLYGMLELSIQCTDALEQYEKLL